MIVMSATAATAEQYTPRGCLGLKQRPYCIIDILLMLADMCILFRIVLIEFTAAVITVKSIMTPITCN
jgi:hypothetical protein